MSKKKSPMPPQLQGSSRELVPPIALGFTAYKKAPKMNPIRAAERPMKTKFSLTLFRNWYWQKTLPNSPDEQAYRIKLLLRRNPRQVQRPSSFLVSSYV